MLDSRERRARWLRCARCAALRTDSRKVQPGDAFVAWPGYASDGRAPRAPTRSRAGAVACLVEAEGVAGFGFDGEPRDRRAARPEGGRRRHRRRFLGSPSEKLDVIAVTGTNGKTSTAWWTAQALAAARPALRRSSARWASASRRAPAMRRRVPPA